VDVANAVQNFACECEFIGVYLLASFLNTQVVQAVSGSSTVMWDPSGRVLVTTSAEAACADAPPRARQYRHAASGSDLITLFGDQYSPWDFAHTEGLDVRGHVGALLLRLPISPHNDKPSAGLRRAGLSELEACLFEFGMHANHSLLFCRRVQVWEDQGLKCTG
jgi:hypothetical protein